MIFYNLADQGFKSSSRASVGVYNVSVQLGANLSNELPCTFLLNAETDLGDLVTSAKTQVVKGDAKGLRRVAWDQWGLFSSIAAEKPDWLFLPKGFSSFMQKPPCRLAVYIHDVVYAYWRQAYKGYRSPLLHRYFDLGLKASLRNADVVFTNSDFTANELRRFADEHRLNKVPSIVTAGIGFDHLHDAPCDEVREGILVYVSSWPHKATASILAMLAQWQRHVEFAEPVYLLGTLPEEGDCPSFPNWIMTRTLPEQEYRSLLGSVRCTVFNSEYEGFGMPPGESVMQGAVPVYSSIAALNEVMGEIGISYDNSEYDSFSHALNAALSTSGKQLVEWKTNFLNVHNWAAVTERIKRGLGAEG